MIQLKCITVIFIVLSSLYCLPAWIVLIRKSKDNMLVKVSTLSRYEKAFNDEMFLKYESYCKLPFVIYKSYLTRCTLCSYKTKKY